MKKPKNQPVTEDKPRNPVAKFAAQFNKTGYFRDKTQYRRKAKHAKQEVWLTAPSGVVSQIACPG